MSTFELGYIDGTFVNMPATLGSGDTQFQAVLTSTDPFRSTLTTTAHPALDGTVVGCSASALSEFQTDTLSVSSKLSNNALHCL